MNYDKEIEFLTKEADVRTMRELQLSMFISDGVKVEYPGFKTYYYGSVNELTELNGNEMKKAIKDGKCCITKGIAFAWTPSSDDIEISKEQANRLNEIKAILEKCELPPQTDLQDAYKRLIFAEKLTSQLQSKQSSEATKMKV